MHIGTSHFDIFAMGCFYCVDYRNVFTEFAFVVLILSILFIFLGGHGKFLSISNLEDADRTFWEFVFSMIYLFSV